MKCNSKAFLILATFPERPFLGYHCQTFRNKIIKKAGPKSGKVPETGIEPVPAFLQTGF